MQQEIDRFGVWELRLGAEPAEHGVVGVVCGVGARRAGSGPTGRRRSRVRRSGRRHGALPSRRSRVDVGTVVTEVRVDLGEDVEHLVRWDVRDAGHDLAVGGEERRGRPAAHVVTGVDVRALVVVDADRHEALVDQPDHLAVGVRRLVHHVAPVAPDGGDAEQHWLLFLPRPLEGLGAPLVPGDLGGAVRARGEVEGFGHARGSIGCNRGRSSS